MNADKDMCDFPIPIRELCTRYEKLYTGAVNDVLRDKGLLEQTLPHEILPLRETMKVAGIAFTIKGSKNLTTEGQMDQRAEMLEAIHEDTVCVWDTSEDDESAQWGEVMTMAAKKRGCRGTVVDGGIRDTIQVLRQEFPVFCRYRTSNAMLGRFSMIDFQIPVKVGKVKINPGDIIFGDIDGVIIIPRKLAYEVLLEAEKIRGDEQEFKSWISEGMSPKDIVDKGGYF